MLARAAESMFWLSRYMERISSVARMLEAAQRMAGLGSSQEEWRSALVAAGCDKGFFTKHEFATPSLVARWMGCDGENPSSIRRSLDQARSSARAMRTAITREMWDAVNDAWLEARSLEPKDFDPEYLPQTLDWSRRVATRFHGAYADTILRNDVYCFIQLGGFLERADNTARVLDVKFHVLLPDYSGVGGMLDYYQWTSILQAFSAVRAYHHVYKSEVRPWNVAELMILRPEMPRSLRGCYDEINAALEKLALMAGGRRGECHRLAGAIGAELRYGRIEPILKGGLHEYLTKMIDGTAKLSDEVQSFYMR
jgi:uncharacterized alpha-E superfamily protein